MRLTDGDNDFEGPGGPNLTSLIDMLFLLIIFFIVTSSFVKEEVDLKVKLAKARETKSLTKPRNDFVVNIRKDGTVLVKGKVLDMKVLKERLKEYKDDGGLNIIIRADGGLSYQKVADVHDLAQAAGFTKIIQKCVNE